jgi:prephenate dehydrogenase
MLTIAIIGIGLIGGSMALDLRKNPKIRRIIGVDKNKDHLAIATQLGLIDEAMDLKEAIKKCDVVLIATPVDASIRLLPEVLSYVDHQMVFDVGSTKESMVLSVKNNEKRGRFVATHPMAGTEYSGPEAALPLLFRNKTVIFCDIENSDNDAVETAREIYHFLEMNIIEMNSRAHDLHAAYVSHISHISSFALALTVLEKEKSEQNILAMAGGGFDSTVRLAKSSPEMWTPILFQNSQNVVEVIDSYIEILFQFKIAIKKRNSGDIQNMILKSNEIRKVLDKFHHHVEMGKML